MKRQDRLKVLTEIERIENEASKYFLGEDWYVVSQDFNDPKVFWLNLDDNEIKIPEAELENYAKFSDIIIFRNTIVSHAAIESVKK